MILDYFLTLLYPPKCVFCQKLLEPSETDLCRSCRIQSLNWQAEDKQGEFFKCCVSAFVYQGAVQQAVIRYKFGGMLHYADAFGRMLAMHLRRKGVEFDVITWVPVSQKRKRKRGYDQAKQLAAATAKQLGQKAKPTLRKTKDNAAQTSLHSHAQRKGNVIGMYKAVQDVKGLRILLIDDVITTGATLSECSRTLRAAGAKEVICATLASTPVAKKQVTV